MGINKIINSNLVLTKVEKKIIEWEEEECEDAGIMLDCMVITFGQGLVIAIRSIKSGLVRD